MNTASLPLLTNSQAQSGQVKVDPYPLPPVVQMVSGWPPPSIWLDRVPLWAAGLGSTVPTLHTGSSSPAGSDLMTDWALPIQPMEEKRLSPTAFNTACFLHNSWHSQWLSTSQQTVPASSPVGREDRITTPEFCPQICPNLFCDPGYAAKCFEILV